MLETSSLLQSKKKSSKYSTKWILFLITLFAIICTFSITDLTVFNNDLYDIIIIGGGPSGIVAATTLANARHLRILLIEAGGTSQVNVGGTQLVPGTSSSYFDIPALWSIVADREDWHWKMPNVLLGKMLGGCGMHNAMLYVRALPEDLDRWNMDGWNWTVALDAYLKMENFTGLDVPYHGKTGPIQTGSVPSREEPLNAKFIEACQQNGISMTADFNAPSGRQGVGSFHFNIRDGVRDSVANAILGPIWGNMDNLHLRLNTTIEKVLIQVGKAFAVRVLETGEVIPLAKNGKVLLAAGALNTPPILWRSGIGDQTFLHDNGWTVHQHLPGVGRNIQDHPVISLIFQKLKQHYKIVDFKALLEDYVRDPRDAILGSSGIEVGAFLTPPGATSPEIQLVVFPRRFEPHVQKNNSDENNDEMLNPFDIQVTIALMAPEGRNSLQMKEGVPFVAAEPPEISESITKVDREKLMWGVRKVREIMNEKALQEYVGAENEPGMDIQSDAELSDWIGRSLFRNSHWVGSAKMAPREDHGVVDENLKIYGIENVHIVDASVIPFIPNGNVHSTVVMVAGVGAARILRNMV